MALEAVSIVEPKRKKVPSVALCAGVGALAGAGARYFMPTKAELSGTDKFISSAAMNARANGRSILKYGAIGALIATGLALLAKTFTPEHKKDDSVQYSKLGALVDASDYACEIMWYGE